MENEYKRTEQALSGSEARCAAFLESAFLGVVVINHEGHITLVNAETERLFGYKRQELLGQLSRFWCPRPPETPTSGSGQTSSPIPVRGR